MYRSQIIFSALAVVGLLTGCHSDKPSQSMQPGASVTQPAANASDIVKHLDHVTVTHLNQTPEQPYSWGQIHWLMGDKIDPDAKQTFGIVTINPGQKNALHMHPNCEELLYVLSGSGSSRVADQTVELHPGDLIRVPAHTLHQAIVSSKEPLVAVISYSSGDRQVVNYGDSKE
jgi:mannose-6-phosphate isomerase-like protein (cupin superfamily)